MLANEQRIGAVVLLGIAVAVWLVVAIVRTPDKPQPKTPRRTWEQIKDSMRHADSVRYAEWAAEREQRYDSFRMADSLRRAEWKRIRQAQYDSFRIADSLWRDSVGWRFARHEKRDTVLDLNRCDTAELQLIRGIGRYTARQIVRYREALGGYYSTAQLADEALSGLHLDTLFAHFTANPADIEMICVNSCSLERLQRHPYLRYEQAKAIYQLRRKRVRLQSMDELREVPELTENDLNRLTFYLRFE